MEDKKLPTAGLLVIKDNKLLLAYSMNKKAWYLPGGKIDRDETSKEALKREIKEELNLELNLEKLKYYCHITAPAYGELSNVIMEQDCFLYELNENIQASNEIGDIHYFDYKSYQEENIQVAGVITVFNKLIEDKILNDDSKKSP